MIAAIVSGTILGVTCGLAPGPLLMLLLAQTLRYGRREGIKVALVPLITDLPVIIAAIALASKISDLQPVMGLLSLAGGMFVMYLAFDAVRPAQDESESTPTEPKTWLKGVFTNLLSPNPWLFWMTVGASTLAKAMTVSWVAAASFLGVFYFFLVGIKLLVAVVAGGSREFLQGRPYRITMWGLGALLAIFAVLLFRDGIIRLL